MVPKSLLLERELALQLLTLFVYSPSPAPCVFPFL